MHEENRFEDVLTSFRTRKGWTQEDAAAHLGVVRHTYSDWETGKRLPTPKKLKHIATTFKLSQEDADTLYRAAAHVPPDIHNFPSLKNPFFTGRETHLEQLGKLLQKTGTVEITQPVGISGLGGIGKTQIALEYAHRHYLKMYRAVLWVNAADSTTLQVGYDDLAQLLELPEKDGRDPGRCVQAVNRWLEEHTSWLLVLDNADDLQLARSFLPKRPLGHIVFTTRSQVIRDSNIAAQINVEEMEPEEGLLFLLRRSGIMHSDATLETVASDIRETALQLVELLGSHPLVLDQAGSYIDETGVSVAKDSPSNKLTR